MRKLSEKNNSRRLTLLRDEPFWLPTSLLKEEMNSKRAFRLIGCGIPIPFRPSRYFALLGRIQPKITATAEHRTILFISALAQGVPPKETLFYNDIVAGKVEMRHLNEVGDRGKKKISDESDFLKYVARVNSLLDLVSRYGIQPIDRNSGEDRNIAEGKEGDIGTAVVNGKIYFFRKGHHRLGAAMALGIERIPCNCYFIAQDPSKLSSIDELRQTTEIKLQEYT